MLRSEAIVVIQRGLGFKVGNDDTIITYLKNSQVLLENGGIMTELGYSTERPWFLRKQDQELTLAANSNSITLPTDFLSEIEDEHPWMVDNTTSSFQRVKLYKGSPDVLDRLHIVYESDDVEDEQEGPPLAYQVLENTIKVWPTNDSTARTLFWNYLGRDTVLDSNIENDWLKYAGDLLVGHAGERMARDLRDDTAKTNFQQMKLEGQRALQVLCVNREMTNRRTAIGRLR